MVMRAILKVIRTDMTQIVDIIFSNESNPGPSYDFLFAPKFFANSIVSKN